ncbi:oligosaccharide flippase family protein [Novosphingobium terrae]|uniref:oligosaccharide flippase family protein n=1 Tax=Novosphingobium terrae TaxID=2726189 RepID=UPI0019820FED|nr:oligosaccharide flippase family protein [Novosphingobium terrae]
MPRLSNTKLNAITLYANFIVLALVGLVANPLLVRFIGSQQFGIWRSCLRILDLTSVADGRATQALKWILAHRALQDDTEAKQREVGAAIAIWMIWLPFLLTGVAIAIFALPHLIKDVPPQLYGTARMAAGLLAMNVVLTALLGIPDSVLAGTNQGFRSYVVTTTFLVLSNAAMVLAGAAGMGIVGLGAATLGGSLLTGIVALAVARRYVSWWGVRRPSRADVKRVFGFSNWTMVWSLVQMFMLSSEVLLIGYLVGPDAVTRYTFTSYVTQFAISICLMTGSAVTPRLGAMVGAGQQAEAAQLYAATRQALLAIASVAAAGLILCNAAFVSVWAGSRFFLGPETNIAMVLVMVQLALVRFDAQIQDVGLKIAGKVITGSVAAALSVGLAALFYLLTHAIAAIFIGLVVGRLPLNVLFPRQVRQLIPEARVDLRGMAGMLAIVAASYALSRWWQPAGWGGLLLSAVAALALSVTVSLLVILSPQTRAQVLAMARRRI